MLGHTVYSVALSAALALLLAGVWGPGGQAGAQRNADATMMDTAEMAVMEAKIKLILVEYTRPCASLNEHLLKSNPSLDWAARQLAGFLLNLATVLDETFGPEVLSLVLKQ